MFAGDHVTCVEPCCTWCHERCSLACIQGPESYERVCPQQLGSTLICLLLLRALMPALICDPLCRALFFILL